jgi:hypothetical protein
MSSLASRRSQDSLVAPLMFFLFWLAAFAFMLHAL